VARVRRTTNPSAAGDPDVVILAVKAFDLAGALAAADAWPGVPVLTVQNGVGAEEEAASARTSPILAGSLTTAVEPIDGGVRRLRQGGMGIAVVRGDGAAHALAGRLAEAWTSAGLPARVYPDATAMKWSKLLANLVGNATSAILDLDPGDIYADPRGYSIERRQLREAQAVMRTMGHRPVALPGADVRLLLLGMALPEALGRPIVSRVIGGARGGKSPSLRLHVRGGGTGPTEAAWLNGAVATTGDRLGVPAPVNAALATLTDEVARDPDRAAWFAGRLDRLAAAIAGADARP
jgi:2-dehydropantoate 2-reductase